MFNYCDSVQFSSVTQSCLTLVTPWTIAHQAFLSITNFQSLLKHMSTKLVMPSYHLIFCRPLLLLPSISPSIRVFFNSSHEVAKVLEFQPQHQSFQWIFKTNFLWDWLVGSPCSPRDSQESPPTPQFKSISSSILSFCQFIPPSPSPIVSTHPLSTICVSIPALQIRRYGTYILI